MKKIFTLLITVVLFAFVLCVSASAADKIAMPKKVKATPTTSSVTLKWSAVKGADYYRIYYKTSKDGKWKTAVKKTTETKKTIKKLPSGKKYYFAVRSFDKTEDGTVYSGMKQVKIATMPKKTAEITATPKLKQIKLSWEKVKGATHYRVYQKINGEWKSLKLTEKTSFTVKDLKPATTYSFAVRAYVKSKSYTAAGARKSVSVMTKLPAPENITAKSTENTVTLNWSKVAGATEYKIYQKTSSGWKTLCSTTKTTNTIKGLTYETKYTFAVKPCIETKSGVIAGNYGEITAKTKERDDYVKKTNGGIKLYPITSAEAKAVHEKWGRYYYDYYEGKNNNGVTLIYTYSGGEWRGIDIYGARYDKFGNKCNCPYCGAVLGIGENMCNGSCAILFG